MCDEQFTPYLSDFARKGAVSARDWVANHILIGLRLDNRTAFLSSLDFSHILSPQLWNAGEPTGKGSWPCILGDICGKEVNVQIEGCTIKDAWGVACNFLRQNNISDLRRLNEKRPNRLARLRRNPRDLCAKCCPMNSRNLSGPSCHLSDFVKNGAFSAKNWVANHILIGLR